MLEDFNFEPKKYLKIKRPKFLNIWNIYSTVESFKFLLTYVSAKCGKFYLEICTQYDEKCPNNKH